MEPLNETSVKETAEERLLFRGFPYLVTRIAPPLHHLILLPRNWNFVQHFGFAQQQVHANRLRTCLVFTPDLCIYFDEDGTAQISTDVPQGADIVSGRLAPAVPIPA